MNIEQFREIAGNVKLIVLDVDGVLTDGRIIYSSDGTETKTFNVRDGHGIALAGMAGIELALISGRISEVTKQRASELKISKVFQGSHEKLPILKKIASELNIGLEQTIFIGDDVIDIPAMQACGAGIAVADAHPKTLEAADWITQLNGGKGAVREVIDIVLEEQR